MNQRGGWEIDHSQTDFLAGLKNVTFLDVLGEYPYRSSIIAQRLIKLIK